MVNISDGEETVVYRIPGRASQVRQSQRPQAAGTTGKQKRMRPWLGRFGNACGWCRGLQGLCSHKQPWIIPLPRWLPS